MRYEQTLHLPFFFATENGTVSLANVVNLVQHVSEVQLESLGIGEEFHAAVNRGWVITQSHLEIIRMPRAEETVTLWTEARSYNRLLCYRDYGIDDEAGQPLVRVTSSWAIMDLIARKLVPVTPEDVAGVGAVQDSHVQRLPRVPKLARIDREKRYDVRYFDIDANHHVNNVRYFDWLLDPLGDDFLNTHMPATVDIKYAHEVTRGSQVTVRCQLDQDEAETTSLHQILTTEETNAQAIITWQPFA